MNRRTQSNLFKDDGGKRIVRYQQQFEDLWIWDGLIPHPHIYD